MKKTKTWICLLTWFQKTPSDKKNFVLNGKQFEAARRSVKHRSNLWTPLIRKEQQNAYLLVKLSYIMIYIWSQCTIRYCACTLRKGKPWKKTKNLEAFAERKTKKNGIEKSFAFSNENSENHAKSKFQKSTVTALKREAVAHKLLQKCR